MEEKKLFVTVTEAEDYDSGYLAYQRVECEEVKDVHYYVYPLAECPEDAYIERDLFSAESYINAINLGIKLAQQGYTKVEAEYIKGEND